MNKIHVIQRADGRFLVIGVANPGFSVDVVARLAEQMRALLDPKDIFLVVPYATGVMVSQETIWGALRAWWTGRRLRKAVGA